MDPEEERRNSFRPLHWACSAHPKSLLWEPTLVMEGLYPYPSFFPKWLRFFLQIPLLKNLSLFPLPRFNVLGLSIRPVSHAELFLWPFCSLPQAGFSSLTCYQDLVALSLQSPWDQSFVETSVDKVCFCAISPHACLEVVQPKVVCSVPARPWASTGGFSWCLSFPDFLGDSREESASRQQYLRMPPLRRCAQRFL